MLEGYVGILDCDRMAMYLCSFEGLGISVFHPTMLLLVQIPVPRVTNCCSRLEDLPLGKLQYFGDLLELRPQELADSDIPVRFSADDSWCG